MSRDANEIIGKFIRRAFWMTDPQSAEFRLFFLEMITELRNLSGRDFNADITLDDLKRTVSNITDKYPVIKKISLNTVFKTLNAMDSFAKAGDLFSIASAVSTSFLSIGMLFIGPMPYLLLKVFAPNRLKCGVIMGVGGLIGLELYDTKPTPVIRKRNKFSPATIISGIFFTVLLLLSIFLIQVPFFYRLLTFLCSGILFLFFISSLSLDIFNLNSRKKTKDPADHEIFQFNINTDRTLSSHFKLDNEEARFLFSLQYTLAESNIEMTVDPKIKGNKRIWLDKWKTSIEAEISRKLVTSRAILEEAIFGPMQRLSKLKRNLIYLECALFKPFFPIVELKNIVIPEKERTISQNNLTELSRSMNITIPPKIIQSTYQSSIQTISVVNLIKKITQSLITPSFGGFAPFSVIQDYTGLVKTSTAVSIGGIGKIPKKKDLITQENSYIIGGGIILEKEMFPLLSQIAEYSSNAVLSQLARLAASFKLFSGELPDYINQLESMLTLETQLRDTLVKVYNNKGADREELRQSIHFLEMGIKLSRDTAEKAKRR